VLQALDSPTHEHGPAPLRDPADLDDSATQNVGATDVP
jgi:hypothetical protein